MYTEICERTVALEFLQVQTLEETPQGLYVWAAALSLNNVSLTSTIYVEKIGMYEAQLGLSSRPKCI